MNLPKDPAKLKQLTREYIIKHCRALEKKLDQLENRLLEWQKVCEGTLDLAHRMVDKVTEEFYTIDFNGATLREIKKLLNQCYTWNSVADVEEQKLFKIKCFLECIREEERE